MYDDPGLQIILPGEANCSLQVSVVKSHPSINPGGKFVNVGPNMLNEKCRAGGIDRFKRAILLIRNPFDSIWAEYQRVAASSHVKGIPRDQFDWSMWQMTAASLAHEYVALWEEHYALLLQKWKTDNIFILRYEHLRDPALRYDTLRRLVGFLRYEFVEMTEERLQCAFVLAENNAALRRINSTSMMTKEEAYPEALVCRMWQLFGKYAILTGYGVFGEMDCTGYASLPRFHIGEHGDPRFPKGIDFRTLPKDKYLRIPRLWNTLSKT